MIDATRGAGTAHPFRFLVGIMIDATSGAGTAHPFRFLVGIMLLNLLVFCAVFGLPLFILLLLVITLSLLL
jgi:hypothetical protein